MRRISLAIVVLAITAVSYVLGQRDPQSAPQGKAGRRIAYYMDPMHPQYKSDKPGIAPDCGMRLEPVYVEDGQAPPTPAQQAPGTVRIDGATQQSLGIRVAQVEKSGVTRNIRVVGRVFPEDARVYRLNSGVDGFIRETYQDSVGTLVKKDQKLASYYSPEFLAVASGFLAATERVPGAVGNDGSRTVPFPGAVSKQGISSMQGYMDRLRNLGMSEVQIKRIAEIRQLPDSIDIISPVDGFILARNISAGQHFMHDLEFYRIANLSQVWVLAEVYEQEASYLRPGGTAQVALKDKRHQMAARITDSLPQSEAGGGTVKLRLEADNPGFLLRPEMLVDVEMPVHLPPAVTVPLDSLVESGASARVYVERSPGVFEPREVQTGWRFGERVEILRGVQPGERVVASATFLVDSESRLKATAATPKNAGPSQVIGNSGAAKTVKDPQCGMPVNAAEAVASGNTLPYGGGTHYFCSKRCKEAFQSNSAGSVGKRQGDAE